MKQLEFDFGSDDKANQVIKVIEIKASRVNPDLYAKEVRSIYDRTLTGKFNIFERIFEGVEVEWNFMASVDFDTLQVLKEKIKNLTVYKT